MSAFTERLPNNYRLHEDLARCLGELLVERVPDLTHEIVSLRGWSGGDSAKALAERTIPVVRGWLDDLER